MGRPIARDLALRDPALAARMGALPSAHYGRDPRPSRRSNPAAEYATALEGGADFGDLAGFGFGVGSDIDFIAEESGLGAEPHGKHQHPAIRKHNRMVAHTNRAEMMLDPNKHSAIKVEGYSFSLNPLTGAFTLGTASSFSGTLQPNARIRPIKVIANVGFPGMVTFTNIQVANVNAIIGQTDDAISYSYLVQGAYVHLPPMDMSTRASMAGGYTGFVPPGYTEGATNYLLALTFQGPAALAGNG